MSFAVPLSDKNPQTVWGEQEELGGRIILTIPFGSKVDDMQGFVSIMGSVDDGIPVLTMCVESPSGGAIVSTIVFPSAETYLGFVQSIQNDSLVNFFSGPSN